MMNNFKKDFKQLTKPEKAITIFCILAVGLIIAGLIYMCVNAKATDTEQPPVITLKSNIETIEPVENKLSTDSANEDQLAQSELITAEEKKIQVPTAIPKVTNIEPTKIALPICSPLVIVGLQCTTDNSTPWSDLVATMLSVDSSGTYKVSVTQIDNPSVGISPEYVELNLGVQQ